MQTNDLEIKGCAPVPFAHYLKALGVLRLVAEQIDPDARGYWRDDTFILKSNQEREYLMKFFLHDYRPTPIVAPWNGGSGFYYGEQKLNQKDPVTGKKVKTGIRIQPTEATKTVDKLFSSFAQRFEQYRECIGIARNIIKDLGMVKSPENERKYEFIQVMRNLLPDQAVKWIDAAVVLTAEKAKYPPLLGTGGNDGNAEFSSNFMQRLFDVFDSNNGTPTDLSKLWLEGALFGSPLEGLLKGVTIGQFYPGAVGDANAESTINPWDFILMIEGALFFATAATRRLGTADSGMLSYPFCVNSSGVGYGSSAQADEKTSNSRAEMWVPLWNRPTTVSELGMLMSEGRAQVGRRIVHNGLDFFRAVAAIGVDRGIVSFQRYGFQLRNGRSYFATPLGRFQVSRQPQVDLLSDIDYWLDHFRNRASSDEAPTSAIRALRQLEDAIIALCRERGPARVQGVLIAMGRCEKTLARDQKWAKESFIGPIPALSPRWITESDDGTPELRLASSLASVYGKFKNRDGKQILVPLRSQMEPSHTWVTNGHLNVAWNDGENRDVVWRDGNPIAAFNAIMARRIVQAIQSETGSYPDRGRINADFGDIADFIEGKVDIQRIVDMLWGLILVDWSAVDANPLADRNNANSIFPCAVYGLLKLCSPGGKFYGVDVPLVHEIHRRASIGDGDGATQLAARRLRGCNLSPSFQHIEMSRSLVQKTGAALLFPVGERQLAMIADRVLRSQIRTGKHRSQ